MRRLFFLSLFFLTFPLCGLDLSRHHQMVLVLTEEWESSEGHLWRFEKKESNQWALVGEQTHARVGKKGLAWGRGLHPRRKIHGPKKNENDEHSPAGIFPIGPIFGFQSKEESSSFQMPYIHLTPSIVAVDDNESPFYNQILDSKFVEGTWGSSMNLKNCSFLKWGAIIEHNCHPSVPHDGSCIFLCVDNEDVEPMRITSTCLKEQDLLEVLHWLRQSDNPIIVQLTKHNYQKFKDRWQLPSVEWRK